MSAATPAPPRAGDEVDLGLAHRFRLLRLIGESTFGSVWEARWMQTGTEVALKLPRDLPAGDHRQVRLAQALAGEAEVLRQLRHAHVARFIAAGTHRGRPALVLERLHETLESARRRAAAPAVAPLLALGWLRQIAEGVAAVHRAGWRHLDLNPSNVLLTAPGTLGGRAKLVDFGTCRPVSAAEHGLLGTVGWMAPEQLRAVRQVPGAGYRTDARADLHGLGLLLFHLLTGDATRFARWQREHRPRPDDSAAAWPQPHAGLAAADEARLSAAFAERAAGSPPPASVPGPIAADSEATLLADEATPCVVPCAPAPAPAEPAAGRLPIGATVPGELLDLLRDLLAHEPGDRPADADAACALVDRAITALHALPRAHPAA